MRTFEFSIIARGVDPHADDFEDRFFEAGCDDATLSLQRGLIIADFAREAESLSAAIASALQNVWAAGAEITRVEPDPLVSLSDIAERSTLSRQAISLYAKGERGADFPPPAVKIMSGHPLWDWGRVADWLYARSLISEELVIEARIIREANALLMVPHLDAAALAARLAKLEKHPG